MKAQDLITDALLELGVLASEETATGAEANDSLRRLNRMIDGWNAERLMVHVIERKVFTLTAGTQTYTYGTGGTLNGARPPKIESVSIIDNIANPTDPAEYPIQLIRRSEEWQRITVKSTQSRLPEAVYDDGTFPKRNISFWPKPDAAIQAAFYNWLALAAFADLNTTDYTFPPGYEEALTLNLALVLAPSFGVREISPVTIAGAASTKGRIKSFNEVPPKMRVDAALTGGGGRYNVLTDT